MLPEDQKCLDGIQVAVKENLGIETQKISSILPFLTEITHHMVAPRHNPTRSLVLLKSASLFAEPDQTIYDIGSTLEYLHTATALHRHIKEPENARRHQRHVTNLWGNEASVLLGDYLLSVSFQILTRIGDLDVLECVSKATQNISKAQVLEISENYLTATPEHWRKVVDDKDAGLFAAGAKCAAYWGSQEQKLADFLFSFGKQIGMVCRLKADLNVFGDQKTFEKYLKEKTLWLPLSFLLYQYLTEPERKEAKELIESEEDISIIVSYLKKEFKKYDVIKTLEQQARDELNTAKSILLQIEMDTSCLDSLTDYKII